jgi:hypothetical protein
MPNVKIPISNECQIPKQIILAFELWHLIFYLFELEERLNEDH